MHAQGLDDRGGLGPAELAVVEGGHQEAHGHAVELGGQGHVDTAVAHGGSDPVLIIGVTGATHGRSVDADDGVQIALGQIANGDGVGGLDSGVGFGGHGRDDTDRPRFRVVLPAPRAHGHQLGRTP